MRLVVLSKMFNESEFLPVFVRHYLDQGCDEVLLVDHQSEDGSAELAARLPGCRVLPPPEMDLDHYTYSVDRSLCNSLLEYARQHTTGRTWWLFPDVDELLQPAPGSGLSLRTFLAPLTEVDGVGCVGVHCLPAGQRDQELERMPPQELFDRLNELLPPRKFEPPTRVGEAWKNIVWQFHQPNPPEFRGLTFCAGSHVLIGPQRLRMHPECLAAFHYKVRSLASYCDRTRKVLARIPPSDAFVRVIGEKLAIVEAWMANGARLLRLGTRLSPDQIRAEAARTRGQGVYLDTPYPERNSVNGLNRMTSAPSTVR